MISLRVAGVYRVIVASDPVGGKRELVARLLQVGFQEKPPSQERHEFIRNDGKVRRFGCADAADLKVSPAPP
jgi:hypothetical protein